MFTIKTNTISDDTNTAFLHNSKSFSKHLDDIVSNDRIVNNDIIGFTETQINLSNSNCKLIETLNSVNIKFNNNKSKVLSSTYG